MLIKCEVESAVAKSDSSEVV